MSIEVTGLTKAFGRRRVVDGISFSAHKGSLVGFLGPNGAGKSTTMRLLSGYYRPDAGVVRLCGRDVVSDPVGARSLFGYLPEAVNGFQHLYVHDFLMMAAECRGYWGLERDRAMERISAQLELETVIGRRCGELSKGWRQRVWLGQALIHDPEILLLDEPTDGLDPNQKVALRALIRRLAKSRTILLSTHILEEAEALCDRIIVINGGRLVADAPSAELLSADGRLGPTYIALTTTPQRLDA